MSHKAAQTSTTFLKMGHSSSTFKPPRCKTRRQMYNDEGVSGARPEKLPSSTMNEKELNEDDRDVKMVNLSEFRDSIRRKMFGQQRDSSTTSRSKVGGGESKMTTRRSASGRILHGSVPTSSRSVTSATSSIHPRGASKRGGTAISTTSSTRSHLSSRRN